MSGDHEPFDGAAPGTATEIRCRHCGDRSLTVDASRSEALKQLAIHMTEDHNADSGIILLGRDFLLGPAPFRCDLCISVVEPPYWTYTTPRTPTYWVQDPAWLVCDACHELIVSNDDPFDALYARTLENQYRELILDRVPRSKIEAAVAESMHSFLDHVVGEPVRGMTQANVR